ncbi:MAG TPA: DUF2934 domain-containing protein [Opitutaceae bacterium]|nr:DUF2934 domain-containing protein [Opitutaceae bacterium]
MSTSTHEEISQQAQKLWHERGKPVGQDDEIWLEAERQLGQKNTQANEASSKTLPEGESQHAQAEKAARQRRDAMAPITPHTSPPPHLPAEPGKPLWPKPKSS